MTAALRLPAVPAGLVLHRNGGRRKTREEGRCRMCLTPRRRRGAHQLTRHHLVPRDWFRFHCPRGMDAALIRDADANIVPLCRRCHDDVETDEWARRMLRKVLGPAEVAYALAVAGDAWFNARYPRPPSARVRPLVYPDAR